ncbi:unnamed protein product [Auanema sp. JU1783]|nr:unnamed protein product [Auanema sp. JU1783]
MSCQLLLNRLQTASCRREQQIVDDRAIFDSLYYSTNNGYNRKRRRRPDQDSFRSFGYTSKPSTSTTTSTTISNLTQSGYSNKVSSTRSLFSPLSKLSNFTIVLFTVLLLQCQSTSGQQLEKRPEFLPSEQQDEYVREKFEARGHKLPYNVLVVLPAKESHNDKFGLTIEKARPVIDIAVKDIEYSGRMPPGWINLTYHDSRYWEDTTLAERHSSVGVIQAYCEHRLDAILGFADSYGLATVTKVSAGLNGGIPVLTTAGMPSSLHSKKAYTFLTRMQGSYRQMADSMFKFIAYNESRLTRSDNISLNYKQILFMYHDKKRAVNRPVQEETADSDDVSSHCYFTLYAIKNYFTEKSPLFKTEWSINTPSFAFDEELPRSRGTVKEWLQNISMKTNGAFFC